jgi:hypothetical protein
MLSKSQAAYIAGIREKLSDALRQLDATQSERDSLTAKIAALTCLHHPKAGENDHGPYTICDYDGTTWPCRTWDILASTGDDALRHVKAQAIRDAGNTAQIAGTEGSHYFLKALHDHADRIEAGE